MQGIRNTSPPPTRSDAPVESAYTLHSTTQPALHRMRSHAGAYDVDVSGTSLLVLPGVWSPAYDWSGRFHVEALPEVHGRDILEIGSGCGLISVFAVLRGARSVLAVDINPVAVENTRINFERLGAAGIVACARVSDVFSNVEGKFDLVIWNAPYHGSAPADMLERACADERYASLRKFFEGVADHLRPGGMIQIGFSTSGDVCLLQALIREHGLAIQRRIGDVRNGYNCEVLDLVLAETTTGSGDLA